MIFVTVGSQMPFDRLVKAVDTWAATEPSAEICGQIAKGRYRPRHFKKTCDFLSPEAFREAVFAAELIVAHAGMGVILTALELERPLLVLPRQGRLGETRNDHQFATARHLGARTDIAVAWHEDEVASHLHDLSLIRASERITSHASLDLLNAVRDFVQDGTLPQPQPEINLPARDRRAVPATERRRREWPNADAA